MRDLSFFLRLHAFLPLARFSTTHRKPYLPLEMRYLIRPTGEVFLYLSNNSDHKAWGDDLSLFGTTERIATFIPATGNIPLLLEFLPIPPEGGFSCLTNEFAFIGMLCRRGLACHYLASCTVTFQASHSGEKKREKRKRTRIFTPVGLLLVLLSTVVSALLLFGGVSGIEISVLELITLIIWLVFLIINLFIGDENV